jgi:hypothetical protein
VILAPRGLKKEGNELEAAWVKSLDPVLENKSKIKQIKLVYYNST